LLLAILLYSWLSAVDIPAKARKIFEISPGDQLVVLGDERQGLAIMKSESILAFADAVRNGTVV
jgi:bifunctional DNA-binding transcriptional regulator/antitoxin component of YhaV-PrlF toxin-antitoxin module